MTEIDEKRWRVAVHEIGHVLIALMSGSNVEAQIIDNQNGWTKTKIHPNEMLLFNVAGYVAEQLYLSDEMYDRLNICTEEDEGSGTDDEIIANSAEKDVDLAFEDCNWYLARPEQQAKASKLIPALYTRGFLSHSEILELIQN